MVNVAISSRSSSTATTTTTATTATTRNRIPWAQCFGWKEEKSYITSVHQLCMAGCAFPELVYEQKLPWLLKNQLRSLSYIQILVLHPRSLIWQAGNG